MIFWWRTNQPREIGENRPGRDPDLFRRQADRDLSRGLGPAQPQGLLRRGQGPFDFGKLRYEVIADVNG